MSEVESSFRGRNRVCGAGEAERLSDSGICQAEGLAEAIVEIVNSR